ncbi:MAG: hypothetical protein EVA65_13440 [Oceanococcus sp.]|nr:MAG: hypothetical protein EVA65_13440 [Oceanococcus sp.]
MVEEDNKAVIPLEDVREKIRAMSPEQKAVLIKQAASLVAGYEYDANELIQEAISQALAGTRRCPSEVDVFAFLYMAMKSIRSNDKASWYQQHVVSESTVLVDGVSEGAANVDPVNSVHVEQVLEKLRAMFADDEVAAMVMMAVTEGDERAEICEALGLSETEYATVRTRIRRRLQKEFPDGGML